MITEPKPVSTETESGKRETFVLYSLDRSLLDQRLREAQKTRPEYTKSHVLRDMIRATNEDFYKA